MATITSLRHALFWARPDRWAEAGRRLVDARRGGVWASTVGVVRTPTGRLTDRHADELAAAELRVRAVGSSVGGAANLGLLHDHVLDLEASRVVETGVAAGWSSLAILLGLEQRDARLWSTDLPYPYLSSEQDWVGVAVPEHLRDRWELLRGADRDTLPVALAAAGTIDLAHYDSDKTPAGASWAYGLLWEALRPAGVLLADDVGDHLAFRDFARRVGVTPTIIRDGRKFQGMLVKAG